MPVKTWVGRFAIVDGQPREEGLLLRSFPRQRPDEEDDELYVLVQPASAASRDYCGQLVDAVGRLFREDTLSMTGAVLRALKSAHQQLREWNERNLPQHQVLAGIGCVAVRGRTAYMAQVGPSVAYHLGDGRVSRIVPEGPAAEPLGQSEQVEPLFTRFELSPGDLLLVASPVIDTLLDQEALRATLLKGGDEALVELFRAARDQPEFSLALLACVVEPEMPTAAAMAAPPSLPTEEPAEEQASASPPADVQPEVEAPSLLSELETAAEPAVPPEGVSQPKVRIKGAESDIRYLRTTGVASALPRIPPLAILGVLFLIVVGLVAYCVIPDALNESRSDKFTAQLDDASGALQSALATQDRGQRRQLLTTADQALIEAERLRPGDSKIAELRAQVDAARGQLDAIIELPELDLVVDVSEQVPGPVSSKDLALGGGGAYFLDTSQGRAIAVALIGGAVDPFVLFEGGDLVGTEITGVPQHIAWAEEMNALLVMDDSRRLIAVTPPGEAGQVLTVRDAQAWGSADGIVDSGGNLYVLDRSGDQVWRYPPAANGFDSEREPLLSNVDLEQALEMAVGDVLYLVVGDNSVLRAEGGTAQPLSQAGIDVPLSSPGSVVPLPDRGVVLVADRGNSRVVVLALDGSFRQQWKSPSFSDLRAIAVDEQANLLYVLSGSALYRTALPALP